MKNKSSEVSNAILNKLMDKYGLNHDKKDTDKCECSNCRGLESDDPIINSPFFRPNKMRFAGIPIGNKINKGGQQNTHPEKRGGVRIEPHMIEIDINIDEIVDEIMDKIANDCDGRIATTVDVPEEVQDRIIERTITLYEDTYGMIPKKLFMDLIGCCHTLNVTCFEKYTVAEIVYEFDGYKHHFFGLAVKNPNEKDNPTGVSIAYRLALIELMKEVSLRMEKAQDKADRKLEDVENFTNDALVSSKLWMADIKAHEIKDMPLITERIKNLRKFRNLSDIDVEKYRRGE